METLSTGDKDGTTFRGNNWRLHGAFSNIKAKHMTTKDRGMTAMGIINLHFSCKLTTPNDDYKEQSRLKD